MDSGNRDLMDILLRGETNENNPQQAIEGFGQQFSSPVSMAGHTGNVQPSLTSQMGQQGTRFHAMSPSQMVPQSPVGSMMQQRDMMSSQFSQPSSSYNDSSYQTYPGYSNQQRMPHSQATPSMSMYQNYGQNGSFMASIGQYGSQSRSMSHQGSISNQYPTSTSTVNFGNQNYYGEVYPSVPPKSPASRPQMTGSGYPMPVGGNGGSYPGSGYAGQSSMSPMQKQMGQAFFSSRSPAASQIHSPPNITANFPGQTPTSPMTQQLVGHPRRSSTSPVSPMMPQGMPVYSMPQRQQQYTTTSSSATQNHLQSSCMFAQRLEKMSAQHQYQAQMGSTTTIPGPTGSTNRRSSFSGQQSHHPGMGPLKSPSGPVSPAQRSPPVLGESPPTFKPLRSPPPYQPKKSPSSFQAPTKPVPYSPQGKSDLHKHDQLTTGSEEGSSQIKAKKTKSVVEKSSMQKLEEVAEKVSPHLAEGLSHAVGDAVEKKHGNLKKKTDVKTEGDDDENSRSESTKPVVVSETSAENNREEKAGETKENLKEKKKSNSDNNEKERKETESKADGRKTEKKDSEMNKCDVKKKLPSKDKGKVGSLKIGSEKEINESKKEINESKKEINESKNKMNEENIEKQKKDDVDQKETEKKLEKLVENKVEKHTENKDGKESKKQIESESEKRQDTKFEKQDVDRNKVIEKRVENTNKEQQNHEETEEKESKKEKDDNKMETSKETKKEKEEKDVNVSKVLKPSPEKPLKPEGDSPKDSIQRASFMKSHPRQPATSVSISRSGQTPTIQATVIAKGQSAQSNQQVLVAKTAGGQMYLIQGNVLIPVQNITVQQPKGEHGNKVICVNQGQGKSSHVMVGNITPNLSQKEDTSKKMTGKSYNEHDDDDLDDEIDDKMEIDLACREKSLLSPTEEMTENDTSSRSLEAGTSTVSIQTEKQILKSKAVFQRIKTPAETTRSGLSSNDFGSNLASRNKSELNRFDEMGESSGVECRKRIGRPPGSKDKHKRRPYMYKKLQPHDHSVQKQKPAFSFPTKSPTTTLEKQENISVKEEAKSYKRLHSVNVPTVSKASKHISKRPKLTPPIHSPTRTILVQPRGGVDGDAWVCVLCGKPSNHNCLGVLYGPYKAKLSRDKAEKECRSPDKVMSPGGTLPELPTELEGSSIELWIHKDCGIWSQGIYMLGRTLYGLEQAVESAASHSCSTCTELGATLHCFKRGCTSIFHFACARDSGCAFIEDNFTIFCSSHK